MSLMFEKKNLRRYYLRIYQLSTNARLIFSYLQFLEFFSSRLVLTMTRNRTRDKVDVFLAKSKEMSKAGSETSEGGRTDTESNIQHIDSTWTWIYVEKVLMNLAVFPIWCGNFIEELLAKTNLSKLLSVPSDVHVFMLFDTYSTYKNYIGFVFAENFFANYAFTNVVISSTNQD